MYYRRYELQYRVNVFFSSSILAGSFSGLLAYAIANMAGTAGYGGWRWIFIIEGLITIVVATAAFFIIPDWPHLARFLKPEEKELLLARLRTDVKEATMDRWDRGAARRCFTDPKIWIGTLMYLGVVTTGYSGAFFTPTILKQLGWTSIRAQVMSIPIYIVAAILAISAALLSDRIHHRFTFVIVGCCIATIGYAILLNMDSVPVGARYFALYAITCGGYIAQPITIVMLANNVSGHYKRSVSTGIQIGLGNIGGIIASNIYLPSQLPEYPTGFGTGLGFVWLTVVTTCVMSWYVLRENKIRDRGGRDHLLTDLSEEELSNLGDDHPGFRFSI